MPLKPMSDDRKMLLVAAAVLLVMLVGVALLAPPQEETKYPSSYSAESGGAKAVYLLLNESGYKVERWQHKPQELPPGPGAVLVMAEPFQPPNYQERMALRQFVAKGGRVVATGLLAGLFLPDGAVAYGRAAKSCPT